MKVCVLAPDSKLANAAILKVAAYHLGRGDSVKWYEPVFDYNDTDALYISKIFTWTIVTLSVGPQCAIHLGGTGYNNTGTLPPEIEAVTDLSKAYQVLYPDIKYSIVFTTRGCVRKCGFCVVPLKEGVTHDVPITSLNPKGKYIEILDNNFFSSGTWRRRLDALKALDQPLNFNTGIDARTLTEEQAKALSEVKIKTIHFAWDDIKDREQVIRGMELLKKYIPVRRLMCYVLVGYQQKVATWDDITRVYNIHSYGITPFAMGYVDFNKPGYKRSKSVITFCRWVNGHYFKRSTIEDFSKIKPRRSHNEQHQDRRQ